MMQSGKLHRNINRKTRFPLGKGSLHNGTVYGGLICGRQREVLQSAKQDDISNTDFRLSHSKCIKTALISLRLLCKLQKRKHPLSICRIACHRRNIKPYLQQIPTHGTIWQIDCRKEDPAAHSYP